MSRWMLMVGITNKVDEYLREKAKACDISEIETSIRQSFSDATIFDIRDAILRLTVRGSIRMTTNGKAQAVRRKL